MSTSIARILSKPINTVLRHKCCLPQHCSVQGRIDYFGLCRKSTF